MVKREESITLKRWKKEKVSRMQEKDSISKGFIAFLSGKFDIAEKCFNDAYNSGKREEAVIQNLVVSLIKQDKMEEALDIVEAEINTRQKRGVDRIRMEWLILLKFLITIRMGKIVKAFKELHKKLSTEVLICQLDYGFSVPKKGLEEIDFFQKIQLKIDLMENKPFPYFSPKLRSYISKVIERELEELKPEDRVLLLAYEALLLLSLGKMDEAFDSIDSASDIRETYTTLVTRGKMYYQIGQLSDAYGEFIKAKNSTDHNAEALMNMGVILTKTGNYQRGLEHIKKGLKKASATYVGWRNRILALIAGRRWEKARKTVSVLTGMQKDKPEIWLDLGMAYLGLKKSKKALEALIKYREKTEEKDEWVSFLISLAKNIGG